VKTVIWTRGEVISGEDRRAWDDYVAAHEEGTVFHAMRWQDILEKAYRRHHYHMAVRDESGAIKGVLSLYCVRGLSGKKNLYSLPFTAYGGMITDGQEASKLLHDAALDIARKEGAGMVNLRNTKDPGLGLPGTDQSVHFAKALPQTEEACLESIPRKSRATVRKSISNHGLTFEVSRDWETLWELHAVNLKRLGTPVFPKSYFRHIMDAMGDDADILFVLYKGRRVCGVMNFYFKGVCNPYFSGALSEFNFTGCNNYMYYALMCHALTRKSVRFDFGKSRKGSGSFDFKVNMGFEPRTLPFQFIFNTKQEISTFNPSNPKLSLFLTLWARQPLWTSKIAGPILNRFLP
jgi:FemAB-related protein (PEP-CTERM system-associated)